MQNTIAKDTLREYVMRNEVVHSGGDKIFKKKRKVQKDVDKTDKESKCRRIKI